MWRWKERFKWCIYKSGNAKDGHQTPGTRREVWNRFFLTACRRKQPSRHLDLQRLASRAMRQYISVRPPRLWHFVMAAQETQTALTQSWAPMSIQWRLDIICCCCVLVRFLTFSNISSSAHKYFHLVSLAWLLDSTFYCGAKTQAEKQVQKQISIMLLIRFLKKCNHLG